MKRLVLLAAVALLALSVPAMAARTLVQNYEHPCVPVFQAYAGNSGGADACFAGAATAGDAIKAVPGVLCIVPGDNWANFVAAATAPTANTGGYYIKNVTLKKQTPEVGQCNDVFPAHTVTQHGTANIRTWWPLMFEVPGTCWTLTITYGTYRAWADPANPNTPSYVHTEVWCWCVDANLGSIIDLLNLFHQLPYGLDEVPLIGNEELFPILVGYIEDAQAATDLQVIGSLLVTFDMEVSDNCLGASPASPAPVEGQGIAGDACYPACCKLIVDAEYVANALGAWIPSK